MKGSDVADCLVFKRLEISKIWLTILLACFSLGAFSQAKKKDSVTVAATTKYNGSFLRYFLIGKNYRAEWATPVTMPLFHLKQQGFTIKEMGGGQQTKSLRLLDKSGREWVLRLVDKEVKPVALPKPMRFGLALKFVQDMVSAQHPYASLIVGELAAATGIIAPNPTLYYIPDDPAFGTFQKLFTNSVAFLEQREPTFDNSTTDNTDKVMEEIVEENDHLVLQEMVLQARLLDMLVADWDRHADQWRWGSLKRGDVKYYYAIPRDRDQAFFKTNGFVPGIIRLVGMKHVNKFLPEAKKLKQLNFKSWGFDKMFLNELDANAWERVVKNFQSKLTDDAIKKAMERLPGEIYAIRGKEIEERLKTRRNSLLPNVLDYYQYLASTVDVFGTAEKESFVVHNEANNVRVQVYRNGKKDKLMYERNFNPKETKVIVLQGLEGNDEFTVRGGFENGIRLLVKGGKGNDTYDIRSKSTTKVYEFANEQNVFINKEHVKLLRETR